MREKFYSLTLKKLKNILQSLYGFHGFGGHLVASVHDEFIGNDQFLRS